MSESSIGEISSDLLKTLGQYSDEGLESVWELARQSDRKLHLWLDAINQERMKRQRLRSGSPEA